MKRAALGIAVLLLIGLGLFWLANPLGFAMMFGSIFGYGIPTHPPTIAGNVRLNWPNNGGSEPNWTAILRRKFPVGSDEATLEAVLNDQGFKIDRLTKSADYEWGGLPCTYHLRAVWKTSEVRKISWVNGTFFPACL
jgi:hypothetical protein